MQRNQSQSQSHGFTLMELMVVVSLIVLLLGFSVPLVFKIDEISRDRSGVNTFGVAVTAARAYATRRIADLDSVALAEYSGAAVMVTPMNQLRIIGDLQRDDMEKLGLSAYGYDNQTKRMEAISMPRGVGVVGITRNGAAGNAIKVIAPPFAIRFNRHGQLITEARNTKGSLTDAQWADVRRNLVYIDHNLDGAYSTTGTPRPAAYDSGPWDPDVTSNISGKWSAGATDWTLPFDTLESVIGVIVYSKADFEDSGGKMSTATYTPPAQGCPGGCGTGDAGVSKWMFANGSVLFFSRNTGNILRTKMP